MKTIPIMRRNATNPHLGIGPKGRRCLTQRTLGLISDSELNKLYNSSKFLLLPSKAEGLGLPMIESMICGAIPITCSDNLTAKEFSPAEFICEPNAKSIISKIEKLDKEYENNRQKAIQVGKKYKIQFDKINIAKNIINIFNSR